MTEQRIKKGLFRLWIVVSVCWVCYFTFELVRMFVSMFRGGIDPIGSRVFPLLYIEYFCIIFLPPVILLFLGKTILWILKGFKKSD